MLTPFEGSRSGSDGHPGGKDQFVENGVVRTAIGTNRSRSIDKMLHPYRHQVVKIEGMVCWDGPGVVGLE